MIRAQPVILQVRRRALGRCVWPKVTGWLGAGPPAFQLCLAFQNMNQLEALAVKLECHYHKLSPCRDPQEVKGVLLRERETSEQLAPGKMKSKRPIVAGGCTEE